MRAEQEKVDWLMKSKERITISMLMKLILQVFAIVEEKLDSACTVFVVVVEVGEGLL